VRSIESGSSVAMLNSTNIHVGQAQVKITCYTLSLPMTYGGLTLSKLVEVVGDRPGAAFTMLPYSQMEVSEEGALSG
jgi:hypothetical protein